MLTKLEWNHSSLRRDTLQAPGTYMRVRRAKSNRWKVRKNRSHLQQHHMASLNANHAPDENEVPAPGRNMHLDTPPVASAGSPHDPTPSVYDQFEKIKERAKTYEKRDRNEHKKCARKEKALSAVQKECASLSVKCSVNQMEMDKLCRHNTDLSKKNHTLTMRTLRAKAKKVRSKIHETPLSKPTLKLKGSGGFTDGSRAMVRDLVAKLDVPISSVNGAINVVAEALGVEVEGTISSRSIRRMVTEGGLQHMCSLWMKSERPMVC